MDAAGRLAVGAVIVEAATVASYGTYLAIETLVATATDRAAAAILALTAWLIAAGLGLAARSVYRGRRGAVAPVLVWQILQAAVAVPSLGTRWFVGVPLLVLCLAAGVGVLRSDLTG